MTCTCGSSECSHSYRDIFLGSLFRTKALLALVNFLRGVAAEPCLLIVEQAMAMDSAFGTWQIHRASLFSALALLLTTQFFPDHESTFQRSSSGTNASIGIMRLRNQLWSIWTAPYGVEANNAKACRCPCIPLARVKRFWLTRPTENNYVQFLSENWWIWNYSSEWEIEEKIQTSGDELGETSTPCVVCKCSRMKYEDGFYFCTPGSAR